MKRIMCLIFALACLMLASCGGNTEIQSEQAESETQSASEAYSSEPSEEYSEPISEEASEISEEVSEEDYTGFISQVKSLLESDSDITSLIVLGGIYNGEALQGDGYEAESLSETNPYSDYSVLASYVNSVYASSEAEYMLSYPEYGISTVVNSNGKTMFTHHYIPDYVPETLTDDITVVSCEATRGVCRVKTESGKSIEITLIYENSAWKLEKSIFHLTYESGIQAEASSASNSGSASELKGNCLVINVFVNDKSSEWEDGDIASVIERTDTALDFLNACGKYYGAELNIVQTERNNSLYIETDEKLPSDSSNYIWMELLFSDTTYGTIKGYAEKNYDLSQYDNYCLVFHLNKKGKSFALRCDTENYDWKTYIAERAVIYHTEDKDYDYFDSPGVYAHEILHLFGADDLYSPYISDEDVKELGKLFPNDIMCRIYDDIGLSAISPYIAFRIGWEEKLNKQFDFLID